MALARMMFVLLAVLSYAGIATSFINIASTGTRCNSQRCSQTCLNIWNNLESLLFPEQEIVQEDPRKILAQWQLDEAVSNNEENLTSALSSLTHFLELWAKQLEGDKALATPITSSSKFQETLPTETSTNATENASAIHLSLKLIFRPPKRYLSYKEQKSMEKGVLPDRKGAKVVRLIIPTSS